MLRLGLWLLRTGALRQKRRREIHWHGAWTPFLKTSAVSAHRWDVSPNYLWPLLREAQEARTTTCRPATGTPCTMARTTHFFRRCFRIQRGPGIQCALDGSEAEDEAEREPSSGQVICSPCFPSGPATHRSEMWTCLRQCIKLR